MLEPLFRCNLACAGCGKIDYPAPILNRRLSVEECIAGGRGMRRADRLDPGRRALDPQGHRRDRQGAGRAPAVRLPVHQRAPGREEDRPVQAEPLSHLLDPSRRAARASRPLGLPGRRVRPRGRGDPAAARARLSRQRQRHAVRRRGARRGRGVPRLRHRRARRRGHHGLARLRLRARARPAALPQPAQDQAAVPRHLPPRPRQALAAQPLLALPRLPRRQPGVPLHALGQPDPQHLRLAAALLPARRGLRGVASRS